MTHPSAETIAWLLSRAGARNQTEAARALWEKLTLQELAVTDLPAVLAWFTDPAAKAEPEGDSRGNLVRPYALPEVDPTNLTAKRFGYGATDAVRGVARVQG